MILRLALAELRHRPGRAAFLLAGYSVGVSVMVVLLAVGEAMLEQARDESLVGGGDLVIVPAGIGAEMLRAGGATSLFLGIDQARFVQRAVLESERGRDEYGVESASPVLAGKLVEVTAGGEAYAAQATGEIPSRALAAGAAAELLAGGWSDSEADHAWVAPTPDQLYRQLDRFHLPTGAALDSTWAEWHYFNVVLDEDRWIYLTFLVGGEVGVAGRWGGRVLLTEGTSTGHRSFTRDLPEETIRFDTTSPDLRLGEGAYVVQQDGVYRVVAEVAGRRVDLRIRPAPGRYFPPTDLGGTNLVSGYVAPALYAVASGTICLPACEPVDGAQAYHDHNWGVWRAVSWEWGTASSPELSLLYGVVRGAEEAGEGEEGVFAYLVDERGVRGVYRPAEIVVEESRVVAVEGGEVRVPARMRMDDPRRGLRVVVEVESANVTDTGRARRRYFVQMRGAATVATPGQPPERLPGFFETYVD